MHVNMSKWKNSICKKCEVKQEAYMNLTYIYKSKFQNRREQYVLNNNRKW